MKKIFLFLMMAFMLLGLKAQETVTIGTGTSTQSDMVIPGYYGYHIGAYLYTADEMPYGGCTITSISFNTAAASSGSNRTLKIYLKEVTDTSIPNSLIFSELLAGATLVYDQTNIAITANSWNELVFDNQFDYSGTANLLVIYEGIGCSTSGGCEVPLYYDPAFSNKGWNKGSDYVQTNYNNTTSYAHRHRPNTKFTYTATTENLCLPVTNLSASNITMTTADVSWEGTVTEYAYELKQVNDSWTGANVETGTTSTTLVSFSNLNQATEYTCRVKSICEGGEESPWTTINFKTACNDLITELPYIENFQNELDCWTIMANSYNSYGGYAGPAIEVVSGAPMAKFGDGVSMMAIPAPFQEYINNLGAYIEMRSIAYSGPDYITVGLVTDLLDTATFIPVQTFSINTNQGWVSGNVSFANVPLNDELTYYIAIKGEGSTYTNFYVRRFEVSMLSDCPSPIKNSVTASPAAETATISWADADSTHTAWLVYYREKALTEEEADDWSIQDASSTSVVLEYLTPSTIYQAFVVTDCGTGDISDRTDTIEFKTTSIPVELPYIQDFEDASSWGDFTLTQISGLNAWYIGTASPYLEEGETTGHSLYISNDNGVSNSYTSSSTKALAALLVDFTEPAEYIMEFDLKSRGEAGSYSSWDYIKIYALDASLPLENYESGTVIMDARANVNEWQHQTIVFPSSLIGSPKNIIFLWNDDASYQNDPPASIDNIHIKATTCICPENLTIVSTTQNTATISWSGTADSYTIKYYNATTPSEVYTEDVYDTIVTLSDLQSTTEYVFTVSSVCGDEISTPTAEMHFSTSCAPITDDVWFENFEGALGSQTIANQMFMCYDVLVSTTVSNGTFPRIYHEGYAPAAHSGSVTLEFKGAGLLALPEFERPLNTLRFEFYSNTTASTALLAGTMEVGVITNVADSTSFVPLQTVTPVGFSRSGSYLVGPFDFDVMPYTEGRIALRYTPEANNTTVSWNLDDFKVTPIPDCPSPLATSVVVTNITDEEATISWIDTDETHDAWIVFYKSADEEEYSSISVTDTTITLTGLNPITSYSVYVQTDCGTVNNVSRTDIVTFTTIATPISDFPYYQTFEDLDNNPISIEFRNEYVNKWFIGTATGVEEEVGSGETTTSLYISNDNGESNAYSTSPTCYASAIIPVLFGENSEYVLSFDYKLVGESLYSSKYDYFMLFMCDSDVNIPTNGQPQGSGVTVLMDKQTDIPTWTHASINLSNVSNTAKQLVFYWRNDNGGGSNPPIAIDNISIVGLDCEAPTNFAFISSTSTEATLSWESDESTTEWTIFYKASNESEYTEAIVNTNPATLTNLMPSTGYTAYIVANCAGEYSGASNTLNFSTQCATIDEFPYFESFEQSPIACWTTELIEGVQNWEIKQSHHYENAYDGDNLIGINFTTGSARLTTPVFDLSSLNNASLKFAYYNPDYAGASEEIRVQYKSSPDDEWANAMIINNAHSSWTVDSLALPNPSSSYQLSFLIVGHFGYGAAIDAIQIYDCEDCTEAPVPQPCNPPTNITINNITATTAEISWDGSADAYQVRLNALVIENVQGTTHQYTGLIPATLYMVEVRSVCGAQTSDWVEAYFATLDESSPCEAPTALSASSITETSAEITWNGNADAYEIKVNGEEVETLTTTSTTLTDLTPGTEYTVEVRGICNGELSPWASTTFTTLSEEVVSPTIVTLPATNITHSSAEFSADVLAGSEEITAQGFMYKATSSEQWITLNSTIGEYMTETVEGLEAEITYEFKAFATTLSGTFEGNVRTFTTLAGLNDALANTISATIYPNPANTTATLKVEGIETEAKIVISDLQGRILSQGKMEANTTTYTLDLSKMASGVYYIKLITDEAISTQKLIVE